MDPNVQELVASIKQLLIYHKIFLKNYPQFTMIDSVWSDLMEKIALDITSNNQVNELVELSVLAIENRRLFLEMNPELRRPHEVEVAAERLNSIVTQMKGV